MKKILVRRLNGDNNIVETTDDVAQESSFTKMDEFLKKIGFNSHTGHLELAQVLKVPYDEFIECAENGFIDHSSRVNIANYVQNYRLCGEQIDFLQRQGGSAGKINTPSEYNHLNYKMKV